MKQYKLVVVDDHSLFAQGLKTSLEKEASFKVLELLNNGRELITWVEYNDADLILLDLDMPEMNGIDCLTELRRRNKNIPVIVVSMKMQKMYIDEVKEQGGQGYLSKNENISILIEAITKVAEGGEYFIEPEQNVKRSILTKSELLVLEEIGKGYSNIEISNRLDRAESTVATHRKSIYLKLGVHNVAELIKKAMREGLISDI